MSAVSHSLAHAGSHSGDEHIDVIAARVVEVALRGEGMTADPAAILATSSRAHADVGHGKHPFVTVAAACSEHGLAPSLLQCATSSLTSYADEGTTVVAALEPGRYLVLSTPSGSSSTQAYTIEHGRLRPESVGTISRLLRAHPRSSVDALLVEPSYPLDVIRGLPDGPGGSFKRLWALARLERGELVRVVVYAVIIGVLTLVLPVSVQALVNTIAFGSVLQPLVILGLALAAGLLLSAALQGLRAHVVEVLQRRIFARVVADFGRRLPRLSDDVVRTTDARVLANRFFDVVTLQKSAAALSVDALGLTLQTAVGLLLLAFYHPALLAFDVALIVALVLLVRVPLFKSTKSANMESKAKHATAAWLQAVAEERIHFADARGAHHASSRADALARLYLEYRAQHWRYLLLQIGGGLSIQVMASVGLLLLGGWLVMQRQLTLGQLVASELVVTSVGAGFAKLGKQMEKLYDAAAAADKLAQVVDAPREREGGIFLDSTQPVHLELDHITDPRLANPLDLSVSDGEVLVITGAAATGKSTLFHMITGHTTPATGSVRIDRTELSQLDLHHYRSSICHLEPTPRFPDMSIAELLRLRAPEASTADLREALSWAGLDETIARLDNGLDQRLLPSGGPLTHSEAARLAIAQLLLQQPRLALIDMTLDAFEDEPGLIDAVLDGPWTTVIATRSPTIISRGQRSLHLVRHAPEETA